jgi:hypothetical protein
MTTMSWTMMIIIIMIIIIIIILIIIIIINAMFELMEVVVKVTLMWDEMSCCLVDMFRTDLLSLH